MKKIMIAAAVLLLSISVITAQAQSGVISKGKSYQLITPASAAYPDTSAMKLTDGKFAAPTTSGTSSMATSGTVTYFKSPEFVGFNQSNVDANKNFEIIIDLGSVHTDLSRFEISYLHEVPVGIYAPGSVTFSVAETRNGTYTSVGTQTITEPALTQVSKATVTPDGPLSGQYVKVDVKLRSPVTDESGGTVTPGWVFLDEISVYGTAATSSTSETSNVPKTGDGGITVLAFSIVGITAVALICLIIRRRKISEPK